MTCLQCFRWPRKQSVKSLSSPLPLTERSSAPVNPPAPVHLPPPMPSPLPRLRLQQEVVKPDGKTWNVLHNKHSNNHNKQYLLQDFVCFLTLYGEQSDLQQNFKTMIQENKILIFANDSPPEGQSMSRQRIMAKVREHNIKLCFNSKWNTNLKKILFRYYRKWCWVRIFALIKWALVSLRCFWELTPHTSWCFISKAATLPLCQHLHLYSRGHQTLYAVLAAWNWY